TGVAAVKLGTPNDEVFSGHPLHGRGMDGYTAQVICNSPWIAELETINKVHSDYNEARWRALKHYVFWFHDSTFECVAENYAVEVYSESMSDLMRRVCSYLVQ